MVRTPFSDSTMAARANAASVRFRAAAADLTAGPAAEVNGDPIS